MQLLNQQVPIDNLYTDVYILEDIPKQRFADISERVRDFDPSADDFERFYLGKVRVERVPGLDVVIDKCKLICLGAPGSGKTTYVYYVATQCNEGNLQPDRVPIFIRLVEFADKIRKKPELSLLDYIDQLFRTEGVERSQGAETILQQGRTLVLLDGLDEVPQADSRLILSCIREFCRTYHKNSIIITCRTNALDYNFSDLRFTQVIVADFNQEQIEVSAKKWFVAVAKNNREAGEARAKQFIEKLGLPENKRIRELAVTPILLNLTCLVFNDMGDFPSTRAKLYQRGIDILLKEWDASRGIERDEVYGNLLPNGREALLAHVAAVTFEKNRYFFNQDEIVRYIANYLHTLILPSPPYQGGEMTAPLSKGGWGDHSRTLQQDSEAVLKSIEVQHGLMVERAQGIYSFSHLTFQEYFTAKLLVTRADWQALSGHITENRWREVFLLAVSMMKPADELLLLIKERVDAIVDDDKFQQFLSWASQKTRDWASQKFISVKSPFDLKTVRAFYLQIVGGNMTYNLIPRYYYEVLDSEFAIDKNLAEALHNIRGKSYPSICYNIDLPLSWFKHIDDLTEAIKNYAADAELQQAIQKLKYKIIYSDINDNKLKIEWENNGQSWTKDLRQLMIKQRNIGHDLQFNKYQKALLQQYYDANKLLVYCLNSGCKVSDEVRQEIEDTLLLPLTEIEKRINNI